jgi:AraC-like DNA-binding protein
MRRRIYRAKYLLREPDRPITAIALDLGFSSSQYFATVFKKLVGLTPGEYRQIVCDNPEL